MKLCQFNAMLATTVGLTLFTTVASVKEARDSAALRVSRETSRVEDATRELQNIMSSSATNIPLSLAAIEQTLVKIGNSVEGDSPGPKKVEEFAASIKPLIQSMQETIGYQLNLAQQTLLNAWNSFKACGYDFDGPSGLTDISVLDNSHKRCRAEEGRQQTTLDECSLAHDQKVNELEAAKKEFHGDTSTGSRGHNVLPSEINKRLCDYDPDLGEYSNTKEYLEFHQNYFGELLAAWRESRDAVIAAQNATNGQEEECKKIFNGHSKQKKECNQLQKSLEEGSCSVMSKNLNCRSYTGCWNREWESYTSTKTSSEQEGTQSKDQYIATLRILCMLDGFGKPGLNAAVNLCLAKDFTGDPGVKKLVLETYPNGGNPMPNDRRPECAALDKPGMIPGTDGFKELHYGALPVNAQSQECIAECCGKTAPTCYQRCNKPWDQTAPCQCNEECKKHGDCCWDFYNTCGVHTTEYTVVLNEVCPQGGITSTCEGSDWIELYNAGYSELVDIQGWKLVVDKPDASQYAVTIGEGSPVEVKSGEILVLCATNTPLKDATLDTISVTFDAGDTLTWKDSKGFTISETTIPGNVAGTSTWSRGATGDFSTQVATPGTKNPEER
mmetsp:Transcript_71787/g.126746  ORF Transcript_71787/g.126746 Transcript_71787/m.126746 type:complete len:613 (+) Transcript_71787:64-1902(+)